MKDFQQEDQALFEAIDAYRNGDGDKATFIYESTKKYTYKVVHQEVARYKSQNVLTGDEISVTEDIMQDLYIEFFNKIEKFRNEDPRSIFKWISVVSHRMLLDYVDKNKMEVLQFEKDEDYREDNDIWDSSEINDSDMESNHELLPEAALEDKEFRELILDFIQSLPEVQAQTILLHFRGGMKYQEIADEMGVSLITVKTRMKKAKDSLEEIITKYEKKTGTKLHSVSILPLLWLLYRMSSEETVVPMAVDTAVTGSLAGASSAGVGSVATAGVTKAIGTRVLIGIVSTIVVIGGAIVGIKFIEQKEGVVIEEEQENIQENEEDAEDNMEESVGVEESIDIDTNIQEEVVEESTSNDNSNETIIEETVEEIPTKQGYRSDDEQKYYADFSYLQELVDKAQTGETVKNLGHVYTSIEKPITISGKSIVIDLNGYDITAGLVPTVIKVEAGAELTIIDSSSEKDGGAVGGKLPLYENDSLYTGEVALFDVEKDGRLILESGNFITTNKIFTDTSEGEIVIKGDALFNCEPNGLYTLDTSYIMKKVFMDQNNVVWWGAVLN